MKKLFFALLVAAGLCMPAAAQNTTAKPAGKLKTVRAAAQYLTTNPDEVSDTCPGNDILHPFTCTKAQADGYTCFDVSMVQGDPIPAQRYELLQQTLQPQEVTPQPLCPFKERSCAAFLESLNYNLDFSWFISNFPSSSFPQCAETYSCTRIACFFAPDESKKQTASVQLSCVYKKNQLFFVGSQITCQYK